MKSKNIIIPNNNKKIFVVSYPQDEHLEKLAKDCIIKGDFDSCEWFRYYFYEDPCGVKCIYTNCWNIANLSCK